MNEPKYTNLTFLTKLSGSTGAELFKNKTDKKWVVKKATTGGGFKQTQYESLADDIYELLGIPVPKHRLDITNKALILEFIEGNELGKIAGNASRSEKAVKELQKGFVVDALLANHDVIGLYMDNILIPGDGSPAVRIDNGGTFTFRATGKPKEYGKVVSELDTMRDAKINPQAALIFSNITDSEIDRQIKDIIVPNYDKILSIVPKELFKPIKDRLDYLIERAVWFNSTRFKNTVVEKEMPEFIDKVQVALLNLFYPNMTKKMLNDKTITDNKIKYLNNLLIDSEAIIGGGFILKSIGSFKDSESVDIDIYVPTKNIIDFTILMKMLFKAKDTKKHIVSNTQQNVLLKNNGILSVTKLIRDIPTYAEIDIVEINEDRTPIDIVKNSDLTFCENWYDGKTVYMTHPEDVTRKSGFVENHYLGLLFKKNYLLINRIRKYINRGFQISIHNPKTKTNENITKSIKDGTFLKGYNINRDTKPGVGSYIVTHKVAPKPINVTPLLPYITSKINNKYIEPTQLVTSIPVYKPGNTFKFALLSKTESIVKPFTDVNNWEKLLIKFYTSIGFVYVNRFLVNKNFTPPKLPQDIYNALYVQFLSENNSNSSNYNNILLYYYIVNLYNTIQQTPLINKPFVVARGTKTWYLPTETGKSSYFNNFTSTTTSDSIASAFSNYNNSINKIYIFYVHPRCQFMNITKISEHKHEKEILFNPFNKLYYIKTDGNKQFFAIFPTDLTIPDSYDEFVLWKNTHTNASYGGAVVNNRSLYTRKNLKSTEIENIIKLSNIKMPSNSMLMNNTKKNTTTTTYSKEFIDRIAQPISTFPGKDVSDVEREIINKLLKYFE